MNYFEFFIITSTVNKINDNKHNDVYSSLYYTSLSVDDPRRLDGGLLSGGDVGQMIVAGEEAPK